MGSDLLINARTYCEAHKLRLTKPREAVLGIVAASKTPMGAYDILHALGKEIENPKPPTVYRAIEFWLTHHFIHRIESLNAYIACAAGHRHKSGHFLICNECGKVEETEISQVTQNLHNSLKKSPFIVSHWTLEMHGVCTKCHSDI